MHHAARRVVVTGLGCVTPLGVGVKTTWQNLLASKSGIVSTVPLGPQFESLPSRVAGLVRRAEGKGKDGEGGKVQEGVWDVGEHVSATEQRQSATFTHYALAASTEALADAGLADGKGLDPTMTGVCLGSGIGNLSDLYETSIAYGESNNYRRIHPLFVPRLLINLGAAHISMRFGLKGPNHAVTTACTTGAHSIGDAARFIKAGDADIMVAGGSESCIHPLAIGGFARSRSLSTKFNDSPARSSRPFDRERDGFVIGEGAAVLILEELQHAKERGARVYAELAGYGSSADAHHITAPPEDGAGAFLAMQKALRNAEIPPSKVDYINAHATSTPLGDAAEDRAITSLMLGEHGRSSPVEINISSTKGAIGHLLGSAGAIEALFTALTVSENIMPPTINLDSLSEGFKANYVANYAQQGQVDVALTNSFGFGGTNSTLCFAKLKEG